MPTTCVINFENNPKKVFFSGQKLHITVRLTLTEEIKVRNVYIQLRGTAHVRFFSSGYQTADENVFDLTKSLVDENDEMQALPSGTHDYSFTCTLPRDLPSSFLGSHGHIKYAANVVLRIPLWPDKKFEEKFDVLRPLNLNDHPSLRAELSHYEEGIISILAHTPASGYAYGENINLQISVNNTSICPIYHFIISIRRQTEYRKSAISEHRKIDYTTIRARSVSWKCGKNQYKVFPIISIKVPAMIPPTDTKSCNLIKIEYVISIEARVWKAKENQSVSFYLNLPITIGTIPFWENASNTTTRATPTALHLVPIEDDVELYDGLLLEPTASTFPDDDTVSVRTYTSTPPPFPDDDFGLPSYEEALDLVTDQEIDDSLQCIVDSFSQLYNK